MSRNLKQDKFFFKYSLLMLIIAIGGFGINAIVNYDKMPPKSVILIFHATVMFLWYILVTFQSWLITSNNVSLHKNLGKLSVILALSVVITGALTVANSYPREPQGVAVVTYNFFILSLFSIFYCIGIYMRKVPAIHKRLMLFTSLAVLHPALFRVNRIFDLNFPLGLLIYLILIIIIIVYDIRTIKKVHLSTLLGAISIIMIFVVITSLINSDEWNKMIKSLMG